MMEEFTLEWFKEQQEKHRVRYLCIVRNVRNNQSKAWNKRTMNWVLLTKYFGLGSTTAHEWCWWLGINPDAYTAEVIKVKTEDDLDLVYEAQIPQKG